MTKTLKEIADILARNSNVKSCRVSQDEGMNGYGTRFSQYSCWIMTQEGEVETFIADSPARAVLECCEKLGIQITERLV